MHVRQQIREQLVTTLSGLTTTGSNVFSTRVYDVNTVPCLVIYTDSDQVDEADSVAGKDWHVLSVTIEALAKATANVENTVDTICEEVETAIFADTTLNGEVKDIYLTGTEIQFSGETDQPVVMATLSFNADYRIAPGTPGTQVA